MDHELFASLPSELFINIFSRLPIKTIILSKSVSKSWFKLLQSPEFTKFHLSKSPTCLILYESRTMFIEIFDIVDELGLDSHEHHYNSITRLDSVAFIDPLDHSVAVEGSVNGLIFLRVINTQPHALYICNPITREFIDLPRRAIHWYPSSVTYGLGISKASGQHKVVRIFHECTRDPDIRLLLMLSIFKSECEVYTIGTGSWRTATPDNSHEYNCRSNGSFSNGCLHWLVNDLKGNILISCFDLDTERFSVFLPPDRLSKRRRLLASLTVLEDQLCVCDNSSENEIIVWLMKEPGVEKSWEKTYVIRKIPAGKCYEVVYPLKVFRDGDILMLWQNFHLFCYSRQTKSTRVLDLLQIRDVFSISTWLFVHSFVSLKSFLIENVGSF